MAWAEKKHQNGKPRVSSKNLVFWDEPYVFVVFGGTRYIYIYIYTNIYVQNGFPSVSDDHGGVRQTFLVRYLEDSSVAVSAAACQALGRLGSAGAADAPRIAEKLADPSKRFAAVTALGYLGTETVKRNMSQIAPETAETGVLGGRHAWGAEWVDGFGSVRHN